MDRRKFMLKSLHKNLVLEKRPLKRIDSGSDQTDLHTTSITIQDETNCFNDEQLSNVESSKPLNNRSLTRSNSSFKKKKKDSCKNEENSLERSLTTEYKLSKDQTSDTLKNNEILARGTSVSTEKLLTQKRKMISSTDSDSDLDSSSNKYIKKKRHNESKASNIKTRYTGQNNNTQNSNTRLLSQNCITHIKPIMMSNISQKELQDKPKDSHTRFKQCNVNKKNSQKKSDLVDTSVLSNFLQKCGIIFSIDGICTLNVPLSIAKQKDFTVVSSVSLARILLEVIEIQTDVYNIFITKLNESVMLADTAEKVPWAILLLHEFRFLDTIASVDALTANIEQLLETCPMWFQHELILFLPDILLDVQHQSIAEVLTKIMEENCELTNVILNCIASFNLNKEYLMEYKVKVLNLLKTNIKLELVPAIIRFLLDDLVSPDIVKQMLLVLRNIEMQPLAGDKVHNCYKNQVQIVKTLKMCMLLNKDVTHTAITVIRDINKNPKPLDVIILLLIFAGTTKQKNAESLLKQNVRCGFYRTSLLQILYNDYKEVVRELQLSILQLAGKFLKSGEYVFVNFAIEWFRLQFLNQEKMFKQREIIEKIILLMGNNDQTVKHALTVLCKMAENTVERNGLVLQCNHLRVLLEKIDCFGLQEVGTVNDLLHSLCLLDDSTSELLRDDLFILLQKQLSAAKPLTKCKGVMGAVMAIKHLAGKAETCEQAMKLFNQVTKCVRSCPKSQPLFYDQLEQIIAQTEFINTEFLKKISHCIEDEFVNTYMTDKPQSSKHLVPKFGLNNAEEEPQNCMLNFGNRRSGPIAPILFRLLKTCNVRLNVHGELEAIDVLLGCGILMPQNFDIPEPAVLDLLICCINWLREIITGFVTQKDPLLRKQVLERLDILMYLQSELDTLLTLCDTKYQPPPCYFHYFPLPPFVKIEKKHNKKGKKFKKENKSTASISVENEFWETSSTLCFKNPAYFRKFDAKIANLLDVKIDMLSSQHTIQTISIKQVCFLVRELLAIFENEPSECFVKELIYLLPKVCSKLDDIV
ncbi:PREDICTED: uncharacterized protein LOC106743781, partial [Dinoponera quadriceps]|uniref:Uncharacterized protein LOC106743781 n=1 Tax=Dinoponera quadriceps TaxID=609295 RepID=A0A6P3X538_DINQU